MTSRLLLPLLAGFVLACSGSAGPETHAPPSEHPESSAAEDSLPRTTLQVEGMICESCAQAVRQTLEELPGVVSARTDFPSDHVEVVFDAEQTNVDAMAARLEAVDRDPAPPFAVTALTFPAE